MEMLHFARKLNYYYFTNLGKSYGLWKLLQ